MIHNPPTDLQKSLEDIKDVILFGKTTKRHCKTHEKPVAHHTTQLPKTPGLFDGIFTAFKGRVKQHILTKAISGAPDKYRAPGKKFSYSPAQVQQTETISKTFDSPSAAEHCITHIKPNKVEEKTKIFKTGIEGFDQLFRKGIPYGSTVLIEGGPGSGKTNFCLQIAHNSCKKGLRTLYMSFEEPEKRLKDHMANFGFDYKKYEENGMLRIKRFNALDISRSVEALLSEAKRELLIDVQPVLIPVDFKPDVVCIDSISSIASAFSGEESRFRVYMEQFFRYLEKHDITSFLIRETSIPSHIGEVYSEKGEAISFLSDGIVVLYNVIYFDGRRGRAIEVLKMRGEDITRKIVEAEIVNGKGFVINTAMTLELRRDYKMT